MALKLYNTLTRQLEEFKPITPGIVKMYNCGPTVYYRMHIGNIRAYAEWDILHRALLFLGYKVERYINFTDVGHMSADQDFGEDKVDMQAAKEGKTPQEVTDYYITTVLKDFESLNYLHPDGSVVDSNIAPAEAEKHGWLRATSHIDEMIEFIIQIEKNGFTYETEQAVYFDISKYDEYTKLSRQKLEDKLIAVREAVEEDPGKKHPADFVLWMKRVGKYAKHLQHWISPWGDGFPGWHIECSAMGCKHLGDHFDIHTGGVDHIAIHHSNERAQNFGYFGKEVVNFWIHNEFITRNDGAKMSKSAGDTFNVDTLKELGFDSMDLRYQLLSVNYRQPMVVNSEILTGARKARLKIVNRVNSWKKEVGDKKGAVIGNYLESFTVAIEDDLNMSKALAIVFELVGDKGNSAEDLLATVLKFDEVMGLRLGDFEAGDDKQSEIPAEVTDLAQKRFDARANKDYAASDKYRDDISALGYTVVDKPDGYEVVKS